MLNQINRNKNAPSDDGDDDGIRDADSEQVMHPRSGGPLIPPMTSYVIDLRTLNKDEEEMILNVLARDAIEMESLDNRVDVIRKEINEIRRRGTLVSGDRQNTMCARCKKKFWLIPFPFTDKGVRCIRCKFRVCARCRTPQINGTWLCSLCLRHREEKMLSGDWIFKGNNIGLYGSDLMRASFRDRGGKVKRRRPAEEASEKSSLVGSTSPKNQNPEVNTSSGQRRGSYSKAQENQKIRVILPPGKDSGESNSEHTRNDHSLHDGTGNVDGSDKESINSSIYSHSSSQPRSHASTNSSFSSRSSKSMPSDSVRSHGHGDANNIHQNHGYNQTGGVHAGDGDIVGKSNSNFREKAKASRETSGKSELIGARGKPLPGNAASNRDSINRNDSFEEIYDSNVNHLMEMMTGGSLVSETDLSDGRKSPRRLPRPPASGSGKPTLLSMALGQRQKDRQEHPPLRQRKIFKMLSSSVSDSSVDQEEGGEWHRPTRMREEKTPTRSVGDGVVVVRHPREPVIKIQSVGKIDAMRDSDSGVNSSQTSRANTPEQKSLNGEKGTNQNSNASSPLQKQQVPAISVTEETREEEDDDLDELFQKHRPIGGSNLSTRSSLRDSRESLYSVYSAAGEENYGNIPVTGEIMFNLEYAYKTGTLAIHIKQCKDLAPVDPKRNRSDPYVKTYLLPDKTRNGKRKTKIKRHTLNPTYNEVLQYTISKTELESRSLWISVWNNDRFGRNDFLGEVTIPLDYYEFDKSVPLWYALQDRSPDDTPAMTYKGDLFVAIKYVPPSMAGTSSKKKSGSLKRGKDKSLKTGLGEIHVMVKEAQNLTAMRAAGGSNPFCKGYLLPDESHHSKQKTPVLKKTTNPQWQHLLIFEGVEEMQLENHGVELTIWDHETLSSNDFLGGVRLNSGTGFIKGKATDWMDARGEEIEGWQSMIDRHNEWIDVQLPLRASMGKSKK